MHGRKPAMASPSMIAGPEKKRFVWQRPDEAATYRALSLASAHVSVDVALNDVVTGLWRKVRALGEENIK